MNKCTYFIVGIMGSGIGGVRPIKCSALLVINESDSSIMILAKDLHYVCAHKPIYMYTYMYIRNVCRLVHLDNLGGNISFVWKNR